MTDRQFQLIMEKLAGIEATQTEHKKSIDNMLIKLDTGLKADNDNKKLIIAVDNMQKDISALRDEITA